MRILFLLMMALACVAQAQPKKEFLAFSDSRSWLLSAEDNKTYTLAEKESKLIWQGNPVIGGGHEGTIQFKLGSITTVMGVINQGEFEVNMSTVKSTDIKPESSAKDLEDHLKSDDFFSVTKFPLANFSIISTVSAPSAADKHRIKVTGYLTIKGISNRVVFPATFYNDKNGNIQVKGELTINRTKWDITHQSKSIFRNLKNGIIDDEIKIIFDLKFAGC